MKSRETSPKKGSLGSLGISLGFIAVLLLFILTVGRLALYAWTPAQSKATAPPPLILQVSKGENLHTIAQTLFDHHIINDRNQFIWLGRLTHGSKIKAGEYQISASMSPLEIFSILTSGISLAHPITIREGENLYEIAEDLERKGLAQKAEIVTLCKDPSFIRSLNLFGKEAPISLEGFLYPDTYFFNRTLSKNEMLRHMVRHFFEIWGIDQEKRAQQLGFTRNQIVTLASIIEKETGVAEERPIISSVFHNRLKKRMPLQSDPTTIYGMWEHYAGKIHRSDLMSANPFNTYTIPALPVGPISNPGKESIQAALYPSESPYYYFVSHNDGTHQFSKTIEEHNRAVARFQLDPKAREGKSWRDHIRKTKPQKDSGAKAQEKAETKQPS